MPRAAAIAREIRVFADQTLSPAELSENLAVIAINAREELIASGDAPNSYQTYVDGREGVLERAVRPDGAILYVFNLLGLAAALAYREALRLSPVDDGDYRRAWFVAVDGEPWNKDLDLIPPNATVWVTNPRPYARKIDVGHMRMSVPHGIIQAMRLAVQQRFPTVSAQRIMVNIPASLGGGYILRGRFRRGFRPHARTALRKDIAAGEPMLYPTLEITDRL